MGCTIQKSLKMTLDGIRSFYDLSRPLLDAMGEATSFLFIIMGNKFFFLTLRPRKLLDCFGYAFQESLLNFFGWF